MACQGQKLYLIYLSLKLQIKKLEFFVTDIHYQPSLMFKGSAALNVIGNIRLDWKVSSRTNQGILSGEVSLYR